MARKCLNIYFSESVDEVAGKSIVIYHSNHTPVMTFTIPSASIKGTGSNCITVDFDSSLPPGNYYVGIDEGAFTDASGNAATQVTRTINVVSAPDNTPPIITLLGSNPITIEVGSAYYDAGATAYDDVDSNITSSIVTVNSVDNTSF